nr:WPE palindromic element domain-containing protein [Wolbachia endosymbiont of Psylliodes chrysocephala]
MESFLKLYLRKRNLSIYSYYVIPPRYPQLYEHCDTRDQERCHPVWDPENFTLNEHTRWLYNRNWIPDWNDTIYYSNYLQIAMFVHQNAVSCCRFR